ncbi:MAG: DUF4082 domain-containing protein [Fischerella sp.]|uniref:DUF4082 domain-containing protein n=1 Tax=Fischerella sp. TaxID=1191 RepID=UPI0017C6F6EA|nr:DUF4082 domain-containing protein [Fischerella sp.]NWF58278.1 DUF4082 domain-containing protein [Fischerella sp.]
MLHAQWRNRRTIMRIVGIVLLAGLLPNGLHSQSAFADTQTYSLWGSPSNSVDPDTKPVEVGVKLRSDVDGEISAVRFYRAVPISSGYKVHIWSETGDLLGKGALIEGQAPTPGWQTVQLYSPIPIKAGQSFIASYYASQGKYTVTENFFNNATIKNGPLYTLPDDEKSGNGVYTYDVGIEGGFPNQTYRSSNYWVDVVFKPTTLTE